MQNLIPLLPYLACPIGMGLAMWFMARDNRHGKGQAPDAETAGTAGIAGADRLDDHEPRGVAADFRPNRLEAAEGVKAFSIMGICLNPSVLAGLAVIGLAVWVLAPDLVGATLPLLLLAACPLSMLFMMRRMHGGSEHDVSQHGRGPQNRIAGNFESAEQLNALRAQLAGIDAQRDAISLQIARLETVEASTESLTREVAPLAATTTARFAED